MIFTKNETTRMKGYCKATCLRRTEFSGSIITTWELMYPRYIHAELLTHRMFSRNSASSRATPLKVTLEEVRSYPMFFNHVGKNRPGMVATEALSWDDEQAFFHDWVKLANHVADRVEEMEANYGIHKQVLNRALEPWLPIRTIVTATSQPVKDFFELRLAKDAQPEMQALARCMKKSMESAKVEASDVHIPYAEHFKETSKEELFVRSVAACTRVCVGRQNGKTTTLDEDIDFLKMLIASKHVSPFEHCAVADPFMRFANFYGWKSLRHAVESDVDPFCGLLGERA